MYTGPHRGQEYTTQGQRQQIHFMLCISFKRDSNRHTVKYKHLRHSRLHAANEKKTKKTFVFFGDAESKKCGHELRHIKGFQSNCPSTC